MSNGTMRMRSRPFLVSSFLSTIGDTVMVFTIPAGLGSETEDVRSAVLLWLIPAVAMFISSFFNGTITRRNKSIRTDYAKLIIGLAILELIISCAALYLRTPIQTILLITSFIFLYAVANEGIPRLLYQVAVYRFFVRSEDYTKIAALNSGLNILAAFIGAVAAAALVKYGDWRLALLIDAATFLILGVTLILFGKDIPSDQESSAAPNPAPVQPAAGAEPGLKDVLIFVPLIFGTNALVWNYLPLISHAFEVLSVASTIFLLSWLRLPGMIASFCLPAIQKAFKLHQIVRYVPAGYLLASAALIIYPSIATIALLGLLQGLVTGIYWPADFSIRNSLKHDALIIFNTKVLRRLACFQFAACLIALGVYKDLSHVQIIPLVILGMVGLSFITAKTVQIRATLLLSAIGLFSFLTGCSSKTSDGYVRVELPAISKDLRLRPELTYAASILLNDTSAHLVSVAADLTLKGQLLKSFQTFDAGKRYYIELDPAYRTARGAELDASDVEFTIKYFLTEKPGLVGALSSIVGASSCKKLDCTLPGFVKHDAKRLEIILEKPDLRFMEKLSTPWLILLKAGKPAVEQIGSCRVPYQTGPGLITACDDDEVHVKVLGKEVVVSTKHIEASFAARLVQDNPGDTVAPTLTVLSAFAIPNSKNLNGKLRANVMNRLRVSAPILAKSLKLHHSPLLTPRWLGVDPPADLANPKEEKLRPCPKAAIKIVLDTSLPNLKVLREHIRAALLCPVEFIVANGDTFFNSAATADIAIAWFTPDYLDLHSIFVPFDCSEGSTCYFKWSDKELQKDLQSLKLAGAAGVQDKKQAIVLERLLAERGYVAPLAEMNWWIESANGFKPVHAAGLFQVRLQDFL